MLQYRRGLLERGVDEFPYSLVDGFRCFLAVSPLLCYRHIRLQKWRAVAVVGDIAERVAHAITQNHGAGDVGHAREVVGGAVEISRNTICSAARPPSKSAILFSSSARVIR